MILIIIKAKQLLGGELVLVPAITSWSGAPGNILLALFQSKTNQCAPDPVEQTWQLNEIKNMIIYFIKLITFLGYYT